MEKYKVVILDNRFDSYKEELDILKEIDAKIDICKSLDEDEIAKLVRNSDAIIVNLAPITKRVISNMERCKIISRYGVGYDNVDVEAATSKKIWVANVPDYSIEDVSDHALALLLACVRKIPYKDKKIREGKWNLHKKQQVYRVKGKVMGLVGYGLIGRALHRKINGLGLKRVLVYDPYISEEIIKSNGGENVDFKTLLKESDYISIHVPLNKQTKGMFGDSEFNEMKKSVILINTSRGGVIDEKSLIYALKNSIIGYAGLDVFEKEPLSKDNPLLRMENVVLTDHTAYYSEESLIELKTKAALNVLEVLKGNKPIYPINSI